MKINQTVLGIKIFSKDSNSLLEIIQKLLQDKDYLAYFVATVNPEFIVRAVEEPKFAKVLSQTDLNLPDGVGLRWAADFEEIIPGRILVEKLLHNNYKIFFLGGKEGVASKMAQKYGGESDEGLKNVRKDLENGQLNDSIIKKINSYAPDILLVAYGAPWQEYWINKYKKQLRVKLVVGVGGTFDYLTGNVRQPPVFVSKMGFEWLWRLVNQPFRWRRQLKLFKYVWLILKNKFKAFDHTPNS